MSKVPFTFKIDAHKIKELQALDVNPSEILREAVDQILKSGTCPTCGAIIKKKSKPKSR